MKRDKYDTVLSDLIREANNWQCQRCGIISEHGRTTGKDAGIHVSHFNGRGNGNMSRYDSDLLFCLCAACHSFVETRPLEHTRFAQSIVGEAFLEIKNQRHRKPYKWKAREKDEMYQHYRAELKRIRDMRRDGAQDYIEIVSWFNVRS